MSPIGLTRKRKVNFEECRPNPSLPLRRPRRRSPRRFSPAPMASPPRTSPRSILFEDHRRRARPPLRVPRVRAHRRMALRPAGPPSSPTSSSSRPRNHRMNLRTELNVTWHNYYRLIDLTWNQSNVETYVERSVLRAIPRSGRHCRCGHDSYTLRPPLLLRYAVPPPLPLRLLSFAVWPQLPLQFFSHVVWSPLPLRSLLHDAPAAAAAAVARFRRRCRCRRSGMRCAAAAAVALSYTLRLPLAARTYDASGSLDACGASHARVSPPPGKASSALQPFVSAPFMSRRSASVPSASARARAATVSWSNLIMTVTILGVGNIYLIIYLTNTDKTYFFASILMISKQLPTE